jgi:hypothetical protein
MEATSLTRSTSAPAVARVNKLKEKHAFKQEFDDEAKRHLFPHQTRKAS